MLRCLSPHLLLHLLPLLLSLQSRLSLSHWQRVPAAVFVCFQAGRQPGWQLRADGQQRIQWRQQWLDPILLPLMLTLLPMQPQLSLLLLLLPPQRQCDGDELAA